MGINYVDLLDGVIEDHERRISECGGDSLISTKWMKLMIPTMDKLVDKFRGRNVNLGTRKATVNH